jgi:hypothetical protein
LVLSRADGFDGSWEFSSQRLKAKDRGALDNDKRPMYSGIGFHTVSFANGAGIVLPHWFFVLLVPISGTLCWLPWRFNLRTLLLALTLVAVVLGFVAHAIR